MLGFVSFCRSGVWMGYAVLLNVDWFGLFSCLLLIVCLICLIDVLLYL